MPTYNIQYCKFKSGERFPLLRNSVTGLPLPLPTLFILNEFRTIDRASKTMERCLRAILHLLIWAEARGIDIEERCRLGMLLSESEIHDLIDACKKPLKHLYQTQKQASKEPKNVIMLRGRSNSSLFATRKS